MTKIQKDFRNFSIISVVVAISLGCATSDVLQSTENQVQDPLTYAWHDGSIGGAYGIGEGWSIELLPAEYGTVTETIIKHPPVELVVVPAEFGWVKDDRVGFDNTPQFYTELVTIPPTFETVVQTTVLEPEKMDYHIVAPKYAADGTIETAALFVEHIIPAIISQKEIEVIKTPESVEERVVPPREGYMRVVMKPASVKEGNPQPQHFTVTKPITVKPWTFKILNSDGMVAHSFDSFDQLTDFLESLSK